MIVGPAGPAWKDVEEVAAAVSIVPGTRDTVVIAGLRYAELSENGWGALIGWLAGTDRLRRLPDDLDRYTTVTTRIEDQRTSVKTGPRTEADQRSIDNGIDGYLRDAGAPPRPRGYRWFLRLPQQLTDGDKLQSAINACLKTTELADNHPAHLIGPLTGCLADLYQ